MQRGFARTLLRLMAVSIAAIAIGPLASWMLEGLRDGDLFDIIYYAPRVISAGALFGTGLVFFLFSRSLACWIVPLVIPRCPSCNYDIRNAHSDRCPECGLAIPFRRTNIDASDN